MFWFWRDTRVFSVCEICVMSNNSRRTVINTAFKPPFLEKHLQIQILLQRLLPAIVILLKLIIATTHQFHVSKDDAKYPPSSSGVSVTPTKARQFIQIVLHSFFIRYFHWLVLCSIIFCSRFLTVSATPRPKWDSLKRVKLRIPLVLRAQPMKLIYCHIRW